MNETTATIITTISVLLIFGLIYLIIGIVIQHANDTDGKQEFCESEGGEYDRANWICKFLQRESFVGKRVVEYKGEYVFLR